MSGYELSPEAVEDLLAIQEFVSTDSVAAAERLIDGFFSAFEHLAAWPRSGHSRTDLTERQSCSGQSEAISWRTTFETATGAYKLSPWLLRHATFRQFLRTDERKP